MNCLCTVLYCTLVACQIQYPRDSLFYLFLVRFLWQQSLSCFLPFSTTTTTRGMGRKKRGNLQLTAQCMCVVVVMCLQQDAATRRIFIRLLFISWPPSSSFSIPSERKRRKRKSLKGIGNLEFNRNRWVKMARVEEGKKERKKNISIISPLSSSWHGASL